MKPNMRLPGDEARAIRLAEAKPERAEGILSRTLLQTPELRVVLFTLAEGEELTAHTSVRRALVQVLDGVCDFQFAGRWERLGPGSLLHLPPRHEHAVRAAAGACTMVLTLAAEPTAEAGGAEGVARSGV